MRNIVTFLGLVLVSLVLVACGDQGRKPPPEVIVQILDEPGVFQIDGDRLFSREAYAKLERLSDRYRRPTTGTPRMIVRVYHSSNVRYGRVQEFLGWCGQKGLDKVTVQVRDIDTPVPGADPALSPRGIGH